MKKLIIVSFVIIYFSSCFNTNTTVKLPENSSSLSIILPLYSYPTDNNGVYWYAAAKAGDEIPLTIIWGMGDTNDLQTFQQWVGILRYGRYVKLLSYVATSNGQRNSDTVKRMIKFYATNFPIDGIFLDEVNSDSIYFDYYQNLIAYAKSFNNVNYVILNSPYADSTFVSSTSADAVIIFENYSRYWDKFDTLEYRNILPQRKAAIIHHVLLKNRMKSIIENAAINGIGYIFVTDKQYSALPSYWEQEVELVKNINFYNQ